MISEALETPTQILDAKGNPIEKRSIVGMSDPHGNWSKYQGVVVDPNSDREGEGYIVAVFFDREVDSSRFWGKWDRSNFDAWDEKYKKEYPEILFTHPTWYMCPRLVWFQPIELVVTTAWKIEHLANRIFKNHWHTLCTWKGVSSDGASFIPGLHACWMKDCAAKATHTALVNIWGSVYPLYVCKECHAKHNGMCGDALYGLKDPLPGFYKKTECYDPSAS